MQLKYNRKSKKFFLLLSYILSILTVFIVYDLGGTYSVYTNLIYIPIALAASTNGKIHGVIHAEISGLMMGFFVPVEKLPNMVVMQTYSGLIFRVILYSAIAFIIGYFSEERYAEYKKIYLTKKKLMMNN